MKGKIEESSKKQAIHRLKIIQGQIKGIQSMVEREDYCMDILNQSSSIQESLKSLDALLLENHLQTHLVWQLKGKNNRQAIKEMLKFYKLNN